MKNPLMSEAFVQRHPLVRILPEQLLHEVPGPLRDVRGELEIHFRDPLISLVVGLRLEGRLPYEELVRENPEGPQVDLLVVHVPLDHLGRKIVQRSAHRRASRRRRVYGPPEIGDFKIAFCVEEQVLRFNIPVDHFFAVAVSQGVRHLADVFGRRGVVEAAVGLFLHRLVHLAARRELEDEVDARLVVEVAEQAEDVGVAEMRLDLDLSPQLMLHLGFLQLRLEQDLERHDVLGRALPGEVHVSELALAERSTDVEILEFPPVSRAAFREGGGGGAGRFLGVGRICFLLRRSAGSGGRSVRVRGAGVVGGGRLGDLVSIFRLGRQVVCLLERLPETHLEGSVQVTGAARP